MAQSSDFAAKLKHSFPQTPKMQNYQKVPASENPETGNPETEMELPLLTEQEEIEHQKQQERELQDKAENNNDIDTRIENHINSIYRPANMNGRDGVFSNMAAKPNQIKEFEQLEPPSYHEVIVDPSPDYHISCIDESGEILIEGFPVGDYFIFLVNTFVSMTFDILGFFLTSLMATTHAARFGSQNGLGLTLMRYVSFINKGFLLKQKIDQLTFDDIEYENGYKPDPEEEKSRRLWTAMFILIVGFFLVMRANLEFYRLRRMRSLVGSAAPVIM